MDLDISEQKDEVMVLSEIYVDKQFQYDESESKGKIEVDVELNGCTIKFGVSQKEQSSQEKVPHTSKELTYIPSISLQFILPHDYPSTSMPQFTIHCMWLTHNQIERLEELLTSLWEDNKGSVILFIWTTFLQNDVMALFNYTSEIVIPREKLPSLSPLSWIRALEDYDSSKKEDIFNQSMFCCYICFQDKLGKDCLCFLGCDHVFCKICMKTYFESKISEGSESGMICPTDKCTTEALPKQIKDLISEELYSKFENGMIERSIQDMSDVVRCPLRHCRIPTIIDLKTSSGECSSCGYVFCSQCMATFHGLNPCKIPLAKQREMLDKYRNSDEMDRKQLEKLFGPKYLRELEFTILSHDLIDRTSKNCPRCSTPIHKFDGCNKMTCTKCSTMFCYICGQKLDPSDPYDHYNDHNSPCENMCFDLDDEDEDLDEEG